MSVESSNEHEDDQVRLVDDVELESRISVLLDFVLSDDPEWKLLCVVGTRGIGNITLVKKVYDDASVKKHFNSSIMSMITPVDDQSRRAIDTMDANMLAELLQQVLESSRYFIVLVDIPDIVTRRALKYVFPVENCGSRVIIISRFDDMCHTICEDIPDSDVYSLNPLSEYESWVLFSRKVISGRVLHPALPLSQIAKDIIEKCNGLPLMILVIAGALSTKKTDTWELFIIALLTSCKELPFGIEHLRKLQSLVLQNISENMLMTVKLRIVQVEITGKSRISLTLM
ncbi:hypothetical protein H5410_054723 [Solanum commersonii]|uniref:NB-ARC domain-containing protein n=1 Tax=Solanum commersonii TaxID=4109 RepID=A0A9J5WGL2_SOLCO|nr:hypothetical protein H5410_054723 [Solanum commersonii]